MRKLALAASTCLAAFLITRSIQADPPEWKVQVTLTPIADTWATHDDMTVHGFEKTLKVGVEPQGCKTGVLGYNPCPTDGLECCIAADGYNYCATDQASCATTPPHWEAQRHFHSYIRFDLSQVPTGKVKILSAKLRLRQVEIVEKLGGKPKVHVTRLKSIGKDICQWNEATLNDTNLTTWSSLPQNVSKAPDGVWSFDVTKAVKDWVTGDEDKPDKPISPNCGFHIHDPDYAKLPEDPYMRWVLFSSKEGDNAPELAIVVAKDIDGDGFTGDVDCDETKPMVNPGVKDVCDGIDNDCSGKADDEVCDGIDNDCDGWIDEGDQEALCGPGAVCVTGKCEKACEDECEGPYDLSCREDPDGKWHVMHCEDSDPDPCLEWVDVETCVEPDTFCEMGWCSKNCLNDMLPEDCDMEGKQTCMKDSAGNWAVVKCGQYDSDPCLEWGDPLSCGKGGVCEDTQCYPGCTDECGVGERKCGGDGKSILYCFDFDDDPCWEWGGKEPCANGAKCKDGVCPASCSDKCIEGVKKCVEQGGKTGIETCGDHDGDKCVEFGAFEECPSGSCEDGKCLTECKDDCTPEGANACDKDEDGGDRVVTCGKFDADKCLEWGAPLPCPAGCALGACLPVASEDEGQVEDVPVVEPGAETVETANDVVETTKPEACTADCGATDIAEVKADTSSGKGGGGGCSAGASGAPLPAVLSGLALAGIAVIRRRGL